MNDRSTSHGARTRVLYCPVCHVEFKTAQRQGVEIDYCPLCQAIWLQRGELNIIVERSTAESSQPLLEAVVQDVSETDRNSSSSGSQRRQARREWFDFG